MIESEGNANREEGKREWKRKKPHMFNWRQYMWHKHGECIEVFESCWSLCFVVCGRVSGLFTATTTTRVSVSDFMSLGNRFQSLQSLTLTHTLWELQGNLSHADWLFLFCFVLLGYNSIWSIFTCREWFDGLAHEIRLLETNQPQNRIIISDYTSLLNTILIGQ